MISLVEKQQLKTLETIMVSKLLPILELLSLIKD